MNQKFRRYFELLSASGRRGPGATRVAMYADHGGGRRSRTDAGRSSLSATGGAKKLRSIGRHEWFGPRPGIGHFYAGSGCAGSERHPRCAPVQRSAAADCEHSLDERFADGHAGCSAHLPRRRAGCDAAGRVWCRGPGSAGSSPGGDAVPRARSRFASWRPLRRGWPLFHEGPSRRRSREAPVPRLHPVG